MGEGNAYLQQSYPDLSYIEVAVFVNRSEVDEIIARGELALTGEKAMRRARPLLLIGAMSFGVCIILLFARVCAKCWHVEYFESVDVTGEAIPGGTSPGGTATSQSTRKKWIWKPPKAQSRRGHRDRSSAFGV